MGQLPKTKPKLLMVEDDFENQKFLNLFLGRYFEIDSCDSADSFYELVDKKNYDLFLMDISISGKKNGLELTRETKYNPKTSSIPIVIYTAHAYQNDRLNALEAGCDVYISKPSNIYTLLKELLNLIDRKSQSLISERSNPGFVVV